MIFIIVCISWNNKSFLRSNECCGSALQYHCTFIDQSINGRHNLVFTASNYFCMMQIMKTHFYRGGSTANQNGKNVTYRCDKDSIHTILYTKKYMLI